MITNIVFDMGNVLVLFNPDRFMDLENIYDAKDREIIYREVFQSVEWAQMDLGILDEDTAAPLILKKIPDHLKQKANHLLRHWWEKRICIEGMEELLQQLKNAGYRLFLLSNASVMQHQYWPGFPMSRLFDGKLISCDHGIVKPNPSIYHLFTDRFGLNPKECLFIDDQPANVAAAIGCGWNGIVFHGDAEELKKKLIKYGIGLKS